MTITTPRPIRGLTESQIYANQAADLARAFNAGKAKTGIWPLVAAVSAIAGVAGVVWGLVR